MLTKIKFLIYSDFDLQIDSRFRHIIYVFCNLDKVANSTIFPFKNFIKFALGYSEEIDVSI